MAKRGRKKLMGVIREPNGRVSRSDRVLHIQRALEKIHSDAALAEWGTAFGQLSVRRQITPKQYEVGKWFCDARAAYDAAISAPSMSPTAQDMNAIHGSSNAQETPEQERAKRRAIDVYARAEAVLVKGSDRHKAVLQVTVLDRRPDTHEQFLALIDGLDALIRHRSERRAA